MTVEHADRMARTYSTGPFAAVVAAGGRERFMNLGLALGDRHESTRRRQVQMARRLADAIDPGPSDRILDVGCGRGGMLALLARRAPSAGLTGVNIDRHQLEAARKALKRARAARLVQADAHDLPFEASCFDVAYAVELLSHLDRKPVFYAELARVLRAGGHVVLAAITLVRPFVESPRPHQEQLRRLAAFFDEDADDIPTAAELRAGLAAAELRTRSDTDLTRNVFPPRQETFRRIDRSLAHPTPWRRSAARLYIRRAWGVDPAELHAFLRANLAVEPSHLYEYHLICAQKSHDRSSDVNVATRNNG